MRQLSASPFRRLPLAIGLALTGTLLVGGCSDGGGGDEHADHDEGETGHEGEAGETGGHGEAGTAWFLSTDAEANRWIVSVVDPSAAELVVETLEIDELAALSGSEGNDAGPGWGDTLAAGSRVFANAASVDRVLVLDTEALAVEAVLDVGGRPLHLFHPNHNGELWSHADGEGAFYVVDETTLAVSDPVVAALADTGHGKLLYAADLGTKYYATNTNDPGIFPIDGAAQSTGTMIALCGQACEDDPMTPEDESLETCGGTHDKGYNPVMNYVYAECSGPTGGHYAFVDAATDTVVQDLVPLRGSVAHTEDWAYTLLIDGSATSGQIQIWDTSASGHDGIAVDATVDFGDGPSARGTQFRRNADGDWEAWIPQNGGTQLGILNLATLELERVEIGGVTPPAGSGHFNRVTVMGDAHLFTFNDEGVVVVDLETRAVTQGPALDGGVSRVAYVPSDAHE